MFINSNKMYSDVKVSNKILVYNKLNKKKFIKNVLKINKNFKNPATHVHHLNNHPGYHAYRIREWSPAARLALGLARAETAHAHEPLRWPPANLQGDGDRHLPACNKMSARGAGIG